MVKGKDRGLRDTDAIWELSDEYVKQGDKPVKYKQKGLTTV